MVALFCRIYLIETLSKHFDLFTILCPLRHLHFLLLPIYCLHLHLTPHNRINSPYLLLRQCINPFPFNTRMSINPYLNNQITLQMSFPFNFKYSSIINPSWYLNIFNTFYYLYTISCAFWTYCCYYIT